MDDLSTVELYMCASSPRDSSTIADEYGYLPDKLREAHVATTDSESETDRLRRERDSWRGLFDQLVDQFPKGTLVTDDSRTLTHWNETLADNLEIPADEADEMHEKFVEAQEVADQHHEDFVRVQKRLRELDKKEEEEREQREEKHEAAREEAEEIYQQFKEGETLDTEDPMGLQKTGLL